VLVGVRVGVRARVRVLVSCFFKVRVVNVVWCSGGMV
jgi:hypothetical protein